MNIQSPFPKGWYTAGHSKLWDCNSTYCFVPYEKLPLLNMEMFQGTFQWLVDLEEEFEDSLSSEEQQQDVLIANLHHLNTLAERKGLNLPDSFVTFISASHLRNRIDSCTGCYFDLPNRLVESPNKDEGSIIRFLNDSQNVLHWYLYLNRRNEHCIVVASPEWSDDDLDGDTLEDVMSPGDIYYCAPTFESFIYRFWVENSIWFALTEKVPLTKEQQEYMNERR